jgi:hypothetical protein
VLALEGSLVNLTRRSFLSALAALPLLGKMLKREPIINWRPRVVRRSVHLYDYNDWRFDPATEPRPQPGDTVTIEGLAGSWVVLSDGTWVKN